MNFFDLEVGWERLGMGRYKKESKTERFFDWTSGNWVTSFLNLMVLSGIQLKE
jgi:hypothetical protein